MERIRRILVTFSEIVEVVLATAVAVLLVMDIIGLLPKINAFWAVWGDAEEFSRLLSSVLGIVVGTEFIKMLSVTSIAILFILEYLLKVHNAGDFSEDSGLLGDLQGRQKHKDSED